MAEPVTYVPFILVALGLWAAMALRYPAPLAFLMVYVGAVVLFQTVYAVPLRMLTQLPATSFWAMGTIAVAALLARLLVPRLTSMRDNAPALAPYAPAVTGSAGAFEFDEAVGSGQPVTLASSMSNTLAGLSPLGLPLIAAAILMEVSVSRIMVAAILPALALSVVGAFLVAQPEGSAPAPRLAGLVSELFGPTVAIVVLLLVLSGIATPVEAFAFSTVLLLAILIRLGGVRETFSLVRDALPDVARVVLLLLAAMPVFAFLNYIVRPDWLTTLFLDMPVVSSGLSLLAAVAFGMVGGSLAAVIAVVLLFGTSVWAAEFVQPVQFLFAWVLAAEAGRFLTARWQGGLEGAGTIWVFVLLGSAVLALVTDVWLVLSG